MMLRVVFLSKLVATLLFVGLYIGLNAQQKQPIYHIVKSGETMYRMTVNYGATIDDIRKWNGIANNNLVVGQKIIVGYTLSSKPVEETNKSTEIIRQAEDKYEPEEKISNLKIVTENEQKAEKNSIIQKEAQSAEQIELSEKKQKEKESANTPVLNVLEAGSQNIETFSIDTLMNTNVIPVVPTGWADKPGNVIGQYPSKSYYKKYWTPMNHAKCFYMRIGYTIPLGKFSRSQDIKMPLESAWMGRTGFGLKYGGTFEIGYAGKWHKDPFEYFEDVTVVPDISMRYQYIDFNWKNISKEISTTRLHTFGLSLGVGLSAKVKDVVGFYFYGKVLSGFSSYPRLFYQNPNDPNDRIFINGINGGFDAPNGDNAGAWSIGLNKTNYSGSGRDLFSSDISSESVNGLKFKERFFAIFAPNTGFSFRFRKLQVGVDYYWFWVQNRFEYLGAVVNPDGTRSAKTNRFVFKSNYQQHYLTVFIGVTI